MSERRAYLSGGHVYCRSREGDVGVETCLACDRLGRIDEKSSPPYIVCRVADLPLSASEDPGFVEWWYEHHRRAR